MSYNLTRAVLGYLEHHFNAWYTVKEVADGIQGNVATVRRTLNTLAKEGAINKDTSYPPAYKAKKAVQQAMTEEQFSKSADEWLDKMIDVSKNAGII